MRRSWITGMLSALALLPLQAGSVWAVDVNGYVYCDTNGSGVVDAEDTPLAGVGVSVTFLQTGKVYASTVTDTTGHYFIEVSELYITYGEGAQITVSLDPATLPPQSAVLTPMPYLITLGSWYYPGQLDWLTVSPSCAQTLKGCWLVAGGAKLSLITGTTLAERGLEHSFGGRVNPACRSDASRWDPWDCFFNRIAALLRHRGGGRHADDGGRWHHVAQKLRLHFRATDIQVVSCGNVPRIEHDSDPPEPSYNFMEFRGTGTLKGFGGNRANYGVVQFFVRAEDRNEPGRDRPNAGAGIDRYYFHAFAADGTTLLLVDRDGNPETIDPVTVSGGNLQLHVGSCAHPPQ